MSANDQTHVYVKGQNDEAIDEAFHRSWKDGIRPNIANYVEDLEGAELVSALSLLVPVDLEWRLRRREAARIENYLDQWPCLESDTEVLLDLIWCESTIRTQLGEGLTASEYFERFESVDRSLMEARLGAIIGPLQTCCLNCGSTMQIYDPQNRDVFCPECQFKFQVPHDKKPGTGKLPKVGKFEFLERVGVGGFGSVWRVRDLELERFVALKIPHPHLLEGDAAERFRREARAAAQLRHPRIVSVHEVADLKGLPSIVSEFVAGTTLKDLLARGGLSFRESAELTIQVAEALDYAHSMGVVHRDLKPANILLESSTGDSGVKQDEPSSSSGANVSTRHNGSSHSSGPLLTDFGLALRRDVDGTITTDGQVLGTLAYMSPEQAEGLGHLVSERSDVFSLGVVLYEMLCGSRPPIYGATPPPRELKPDIPRDLEAICQKAKATKPQDRYESAKEFAEDLERWLRYEPTQARPLSRMMVAWRLARRKPLVAGLSAALAVAVVGLIISLGIVLRVTQNELSSSRALEQSLELAKQDAMDVLSSHLPSLHDPADETTPAPDQDLLRIHALELTQSFYEKRVSESPADPDIGLALGRTLVNLAVGYRDLGNAKESERRFVEAIDLFQGLSVDHPDVAAYQQNLAICYHNLGKLLKPLKQIERARSAFQNAMEVRKELSRRFPGNQSILRKLAGSHNAMGTMYAEIGSTSLAESQYQQSLEILKNLDQSLEVHVQTALSYMNLGLNFGTLGQIQDKEECLQKAIAAWKRIEPEIQENSEYLGYMAGTYHAIGGLLAQKGITTEARSNYEKAKGVFTRLVAQHPLVPEYANDLARVLSSQGRLFRELGKLSESELALTAAYEIHHRLVQSSKDVSLKDSYAETCNLLAQVLNARGKQDDAEKLLLQILTIRSEIVESHPSSLSYQRQLGVNLNNLGVLYLSQDKAELAEGYFRQSLSIRTQLVSAYPKTSTYRIDLGVTQTNLASLLETLGQYEEAVKEYNEGIATLLEQVEQEPTNLRNRNFLLKPYTGQANALERLDRYKEALRDRKKAVAVSEAWASQSPETHDDRELARLYRSQAITALGGGDLEDAYEAFRSCHKIRQRVVSQAPGETLAHLDLARSRRNLGSIEQIRGNYSISAQWYEQAIELVKGFADHQAVRNLAQPKEWIENWPIELQNVRSCQKAVESLDYALSQPPDKAAELLEIRASALIRDNRFDSASEAADKRKTLTKGDPDNLFQAAIIYARCATAIDQDESVSVDERAEKRERYIENAVETLLEAVDAGFDEFQAIEKADALKSIRQHPRVKELLSKSR